MRIFSLSHRYLIESCILGIVAAFFYRSGLFILFFAAPLQVLFIRQGRAGLLVGGGVALTITLLTSVVSLTRAPSLAYAPLAVIDMAIPVALVGGLFLLDIEIPAIQRRIYKLCVAAGLAFIALVPILLVVQNSPTTLELLTRLVIDVARAIQPNGLIESVFERDIVNQTLLIMVQWFAATIVPIYVAMLSIAWYVGSHIGAATIKKPHLAIGLSSFKVPDRFLWPTIISLGIAIAGLIIDLGILNYLVWNVALVGLFIYAVQGSAIICFWIARKISQRRATVLFWAGLIVSLFIPVFNAVVIFGIVGIGFSDVWIDYRRRLGIS